MTDFIVGDWVVAHFNDGITTPQMGRITSIRDVGPLRPDRNYRVEFITPVHGFEVMWFSKDQLRHYDTEKDEMPSNPKKDQALAALKEAEDKYALEKLNLDQLVNSRNNGIIATAIGAGLLLLSGFTNAVGMQAWLAFTVPACALALIWSVVFFYQAYESERICTDPRYPILGTDYYGPKLTNAYKRELAARLEVNRAESAVVETS